MPSISRIYKGNELVYEAPAARSLTAFLTDLKVGDRIELFRAANVRTDAVISSATLKGVNLTGTQGTVTGGPKTGVSNSTWYNINFDSGFDGWCVSDNYTKIASGGGGGGSSTTNKFKIGDKIRLFRASNVRSSAGIKTNPSNLIGVSQTNTLGKIVGGPTVVAGATWYNIDFEGGFDGWVVSDNYDFATPVNGGGGGGNGGNGGGDGGGGVIQPPNSAGWIAPNASILSDASKRAPEYFGTGDTTVKVGGHFGAPMAVLAYNSWTGNSSTDAKVLAAVRNCLSGNKAPAAASGFSMQFEAGNWAAVVALAKLTPRVWNQLSSTEKAKIDILMKALAKAAAWSSSDKTKETHYTLAGIKNNYPRGNANYQLANPFMLSIMIAYMGSVSAVDTFLRTTSAQSIASGLSAQGMSNTLWAWKSPRPSGAPSYATIDNSCNGWTFKNRPLSDMKNIFKEQMQRTYGEVSFIAHPQSSKMGGRGKLMGPSTAALNAWVGKVGMPDEMAASDGGGLRSSAAYSMMELRQTWIWFIIMLTSGQMAKNDPVMQAVKGQVNVGYNWYSKMVDIGWKDYSKGGSGSGNSDFKRSQKGEQYGMDFNLPMWINVIYPML